MSRKEAVELTKQRQYEFPEEYFEDYLEYHQINEKEYFMLEDKWRNKDIWVKKNGEWRLRVEIS